VDGDGRATPVRYHLLAAIEKRCLDQGLHTSWAARTSGIAEEAGGTN